MTLPSPLRQTLATEWAPHAAGPVGEAALGRALARRGRALLEADDPEAAIRRLTPLEAFWAIKEVGLADADALVAGLDPQALQACVDLDIWRNDALDTQAVDAWLAAATRAHAARGLPHAAALAGAFDQLDEEVATLFLARSVASCDRGEDDQAPAADTGGAAARPTADATLWVWTTAGEPRGVDRMHLVEALYRADPVQARRRLMGARWELGSQLEEEALGFRHARLEDLGFPPAHESMGLWARPPAEPPLPRLPTADGGRGPGLPAALAVGLGTGGELARAMGAIDDPDVWQAQCGAFVGLTNAFWVACRQPAADAAFASACAARVAGAVSLGLAAAAGGPSPEALREALAAWGMRALFQAGRMQLVPLARRAQALRTRAELATHLGGPPPPPESPWAAAHALVASLCQPLPEWARADVAGVVRPRAIGRQEDIRAIAAELDAIEAEAPAAATRL